MEKYIIIGIIVVTILLIIGAYNKLVRLKNEFKNAYSQIDVQLKRRYDLIPNLIETVKGYMKHERETLEAVIKARNQAVQACADVKSDSNSPLTMQKLSSAEQQLNRVLGNFFALSENYPELKANENFSNLIEELSSTENKIGFARQAYNDAVTFYNTTCESFPSSLIASFFKFKNAELLKIENEQERKAIHVKF